VHVGWDGLIENNGGQWLAFNRTPRYALVDNLACRNCHKPIGPSERGDQV
jgi:hypothetical protein